MENILVTGGCGFIGSHVVLSLLKEGYNVSIIDSNVNSSKDVVKKIKILAKINSFKKTGKLSFFKGDIRNKLFLQKIFHENDRKGYKINAVIHLAGLKSVKESIKYPEKYKDNNVNGSLTLLNTMIKNECFNLVFSSSATVYGHPKTTPIFENFETKPINPYGQTKLDVENLIKEKFKKYSNQFKVIVLRYFNPVGAHPSGIIGEKWKYCPDNIFPNILRAALKKLDYLKIYGNNWPTLDGTTIRDFIHIMDLAEGHVAAINYMQKQEAHYWTINLGTGRETSILQLINNFKSINKVDIQLKFMDKRDGDTPFLLADSNLARQILNWRTKKDLFDVCKDGWKFAKQNQDGF